MSNHHHLTSSSQQSNGNGHYIHHTSSSPPRQQKSMMKRTNSRRAIRRRPTPHPRIFLLNRLYAKRWWIIAIILTVILFGVLDEKAEQKAAKSNANNDNKVQVRQKQSSLSGIDTSVLLQRATKTMQQDRVGKVDFFWQMPAVLPLRGILFLAHGCNHAGTDWWPYNAESCPTCLELPEERAIVESALTRFRLAAVSVSSSDRRSQCWSQTDGPRVAQVLQHMRQLLASSAHNNTELPIFALGASSGGGFVSHVLPADMQTAGLPLTGFISEISPPKKSTPDNVASVFITMPKDAKTRSSSEAFVEQQTKAGHTARHIAVKEAAITPKFFHERIPSISPDLSKQLAETLKEKSYLDTSTNMLVSDPRQSEWRTVLKPILEAAKHEDSLVADNSPISEVMNVAWGRHEMTRDGVAGALGWLLAAWQKARAAKSV